VEIGMSNIATPSSPGPFLLGVADASAEDAATAGKGTASPARHAFWPGGTPATEVAVPGSERPAKPARTSLITYLLVHEREQGRLRARLQSKGEQARFCKVEPGKFMLRASQ
jgi:hypothetical protein